MASKGSTSVDDNRSKREVEWLPCRLYLRWLGGFGVVAALKLGRRELAVFFPATRPSSSFTSLTVRLSSAGGKSIPFCASESNAAAVVADADDAGWVDLTPTVAPRAAAADGGVVDVSTGMDFLLGRPPGGGIISPSLRPCCPLPSPPPRPLPPPSSSSFPSEARRNFRSFCCDGVGSRPLRMSSTAASRRAAVWLRGGSAVAPLAVMALSSWP
mmetsp:Transcript_22026/g.42851  ORF Transcript_22026/g.42851 Transcript_22026/m.42851 type:complete len:214 (+) Transcript_22026:82-723(+)